MKNKKGPKLDSIGFGNDNRVNYGDKFNKAGIILSAFGLGITIIGRVLRRKGSVWYVNGSEEDINHWYDLHQELESRFDQ